MQDRVQPEFSAQELAHYARHLAIPGFGLEGQDRLRQGRVLVVGAGGLGSPLLLYLAAAGVGHIGIIDFDRVDISNLQRQVLYTIDDVGRPKAELARRRLLEINPHINIKVYPEALTRSNALDIISDYDVVADGTDNFPTRYLVNDACVLTGKVNVYASIFRFEGQVSVFNWLQPDGLRGPNYRDLYPEPPPPDLVPDCAEGGVLGVLPGIIGSMQASEVIKVLTGLGEPLSGRLFLFDALAFSTRVMSFGKRPDIQISELIDYESFCGINSEDTEDIPTIEVAELQAMLDSGSDIQLLDVREPHEYQLANLGGRLIPIDTLPEAVSSLDKDRRVVVHCQSGRRSARAVRLLQQVGFRQVSHLEGGMNKWLEWKGRARMVEEH